MRAELKDELILSYGPKFLDACGDPELTEDLREELNVLCEAYRLRREIPQNKFYQMPKPESGSATFSRNRSLNESYGEKVDSNSHDPIAEPGERVWT